MAATGGPLYFMFLGPPPSDHPGSDTEYVKHKLQMCSCPYTTFLSLLHVAPYKRYALSMTAFVAEAIYESKLKIPIKRQGGGDLTVIPTPT